VRVVIDGERCAGHGRCYVIAPELFTDDERGYGATAGDGAVTPDQADLARRAVAACPERAISIVEDERT
jgi:ferredoxin